MASRTRQVSPRVVVRRCTVCDGGAATPRNTGKCPWCGGSGVIAVSVTPNQAAVVAAQLLEAEGWRA